MKYYCVTSSVDNRGRVSARITASVEADHIPENSYTSTTRKDIYSDWFGSLEEAREFVAEAQNA